MHTTAVMWLSGRSITLAPGGCGGGRGDRGSRLSTHVCAFRRIRLGGRGSGWEKRPCNVLSRVHRQWATLVRLSKCHSSIQPTSPHPEETVPTPNAGIGNSHPRLWSRTFPLHLTNQKCRNSSPINSNRRAVPTANHLITTLRIFEILLVRSNQKTQCQAHSFHKVHARRRTKNSPRLHFISLVSGPWNNVPILLAQNPPLSW